MEKKGQNYSSTLLRELSNRNFKDLFTEDLYNFEYQKLF